MNRAASLTPQLLARMLPCVSTTPFGSLVEPEENWMKATSSGSRALTLAGARDVIEIVDQEGARAQPLEQLLLTDLRGKGADALERAALGVDEGVPSLRAMRSSLWRCSSLMPSATGTGMMPPRIAAQKASMNCSLLPRNRISLSPRRAPRRCR